MPAITLKSVNKHFESQRGIITQALSNINLHVREGQIACLVGPSGCGKTTLLNLIAGFETPTSGSVLVDDKPVSGPGSDRVVIFQDVHGSLMPWWTAAQNVEFGLLLAKSGTRQKRQELAHRYLSIVGLEGAAEKYPEEMSGGMQQRVQIARALVTKPIVLLMDEPFGALDFLTRSNLQLLFQDLHGRTPTTTIFVTHDISEAAILGDAVFVMNTRGTIVDHCAIGAPRPRLLTDPMVAKVINRLMQLLLPDAASHAHLSPGANDQQS